MKIYNRYNSDFIGEFDIRPDANLQNANLRNADLSDINLCGANLQGADLKNASLRNASLCCADLRGADLRGADLSGADLNGSNIDKTTKFSKFQLPQTKSLIVFKKVCVGNGFAIAKLRIPCRAKRTATPLGNKCRAERAFVLEIKRIDNGELVQKAFSMHAPSFIYEVGKEVKPKAQFDGGPPYDGDIRVECTSGIHFFLTEEEAMWY